MQDLAVKTLIEIDYGFAVVLRSGIPDKWAVSIKYQGMLQTNNLFYFTVHNNAYFVHIEENIVKLCTAHMVKMLDEMQKIGIKEEIYQDFEGILQKMVKKVESAFYSDERPIDIDKIYNEVKKEENPFFRYFE